MAVLSKLCKLIKVWEILIIKVGNTGITKLFPEMVIPSLQFCRVSSSISKEDFLEKLSKLANDSLLKSSH